MQKLSLILLICLYNCLQSLVSENVEIIYSTATQCSQYDPMGAKIIPHSPHLPLQLFEKLSFRKCPCPYLYQASFPVIIQVLVNALSPVSLQ